NDRMETLAEYLDRLMRQKNLDPSELAKRSGLTSSYIGRLRNGKLNNPTVETILKLATGLDVNAHEIFAVASGNPVSKTPPIDLGLLFDQMLKLINDANGFEALRQLLNFSPDERKTLLDYMEYFKRQPPKAKGKSRKKAKPHKK
ncbi:MAG: Cro/C1-type DNA-binding domain, partial [Blastocatellia bacterium]